RSGFLVTASLNDRAIWPFDPMTKIRMTGSRFDETETRPAIYFVAQRSPPGLVGKIPTYGFFNTRFKCLLGAPTQLTLQLGRVNRVPVVVPRAIGYKRDQIVVGLLCGSHSIH